MKASHSIEQFVEDMERGPAYVHIPIKELPGAHDLLSKTLISKVGNDRVRETICEMSEHLRAICPRCCSWSPGDNLGMVALIRTLNPASVTMSRNGDISHLLDGCCINSQCDCKEILLIWKGWNLLEEMAREHLGRVRADAERMRDPAKLRCVDALASPEVLSFTKDVCFVLHRNCSTDPSAVHTYVAKAFASVPNFYVWISHVGGGVDGLRRAFPQGYTGFLQTILDRTEYSRGDRSIAHWIRHQIDGRWMVSLALLPEGNLPKEERFLVLPQDLLSEVDLAKLKDVEHRSC